MNQTNESDGAGPPSCTAPERPDFSRIPAYVEPPRPTSARKDNIGWISVSAILVVALATTGFFGLYVYAEQADRPEPILSPQPQDMAATGDTPASPPYLPLPAGVQFSPTPRPQHPAPLPKRPLHPTRLMRPSRG